MMLTLSLLCVFAYLAGLVDSAVGGGGLVQIPALFAILPRELPVTLLGSNKFTSALGTTFAARSYLRRVRLPWVVILPAASAAFVMSFVGAAAVSLVPKGVLRPMVLVLLLLIGYYTLQKKDFGALHVSDLSEDLTRMRELFDTFERKTELLKLLNQSRDAHGVNLYIGEESGVTTLDECSVVTASYRINGQVVGTLGVIGPTRMAYERVIPIVDITARLVSSALSYAE